MMIEKITQVMGENTLVMNQHNILTKNSMPFCYCNIFYPGINIPLDNKI